MVWISVPSPASAVTVGPAKMEFRVDPGERVEGTITLINDSDGTQVLYPDFEKFTEVNGVKQFSPGEYTALTSWIQLPKSVSMERGEQKNVPFTMEVPKNAPPGGHFAVVWWSTAPPKGQVSIVTRAGILVYVRVSGEVSEKGKIIKFSGEKGMFFLSFPKDFTVNFKNEGNTYLKPSGEIEIKNIFGSGVANFKVNGKERIIFPQNEQILDVAKKFEKAPFAFGLYRAELSLSWGEKKESNVVKNLWIFIFPWKVALLGVVLLLALYLLLTKGIKKYNKWIVKKYSAGKK